MTPHTAYSTIHPAPLGVILAGLTGDIPRYEREKASVFTRKTPVSQPQKASVLDLRSRILDVLGSAALVLDALECKRMDANAVADEVGRKRSTVYKALYDMTDLGVAEKKQVSRICVEWRAA